MARFPLADGCGWQGISLCFTLTRQSVDQRDVETRLSDASLGVRGPYRHGFTPRQTCTKQIVILKTKGRPLKEIEVKARECTLGTWLGII